MQMDLLKTERALVTGARCGIGCAIAEAYAGQTAALILHAEPSFKNDLEQVDCNHKHADSGKVFASSIRHAEAACSIAEEKLVWSSAD